VSAVRVARSIGLTLASVILAVSGIYVVVDLARWEWNRAVISGLVFVAALIVIVAMILFRQLRSIDHRLSALEEMSESRAHMHGVLKETNDHHAARHFRWLETSTDRLGVFVPVLLGAGVVLSFIAYVVERIAGAFATTALDPLTVRELKTSLPLGDGLVKRRTVGPDSESRHRPLALGIVVAVSVIASFVTVEGLRRLTQTRPSEITSTGTASVTVRIEQRRDPDSIVVVANSLWGACRSRLPSGVRVLWSEQVAPDTARLDIDTALGRTGRARITGCLEDHTLDLVRADVLDITVSPDP
jgi:hypothetical protein